MYRIFSVILILLKINVLKKTKNKRIKKFTKINKNCQKHDSSQLFIHKQSNFSFLDSECLTLSDLMCNFLHSSIIVYVSSKNHKQSFAGILIQVRADFIVLLYTKYIRLPFRVLYNSKLISIPISKIQAVSYYSNSYLQQR